MPSPALPHTLCEETFASPSPLRQAFYDDRLEAFFSAHSAALGQAADALPAPVAITVAVAVDLGLAAAFAVDKLGGLALALVLAAALSLRSATGKPKRA